MTDDRYHQLARYVRALRFGRKIDREFTSECSRLGLDQDSALAAPLAAIITETQANAE